MRTLCISLLFPMLTQEIRVQLALRHLQIHAKPVINGARDHGLHGARFGQFAFNCLLCQLLLSDLAA